MVLAMTPLATRVLPRLVGHEEAARGLFVEVEPLEDVLDGGALEILELGEDGVDVEGGGVVGHDWASFGPALSGRGGTFGLFTVTLVAAGGR